MSRQDKQSCPSILRPVYRTRIDTTRNWGLRVTGFGVQGWATSSSRSGMRWQGGLSPTSFGTSDSTTPWGMDNIRCEIRYKSRYKIRYQIRYKIGYVRYVRYVRYMRYVRCISYVSYIRYMCCMMHINYAVYMLDHVMSCVRSLHFTVQTLNLSLKFKFEFGLAGKTAPSPLRSSSSSTLWVPNQTLTRVKITFHS